MDPELERRTLAAEDDLWWYRGRRAIVMDAVRRAAPAGHVRVLDAGCGGGAELPLLAALGEVSGLEPSAPSRERALARGAGPVVDAFLEDLPFETGAFDLAVCLDVIEHLEDDQPALAELRRVVRPGGALVLTVPAHPRMWSHHDDVNHHYRRYTRAALAATARETGWDPVLLTHFNATLLPVAWAARVAGARGGDGLDVPPAPVNRALELILRAEGAAIRAGLSLPVGLSLLAELRR